MDLANFIEVEPILPTYYVFDNCMVARIVKQFISVNQNEPDKLIIQGIHASCFMVCFMVDDDPNQRGHSFSTHPLHPDTMKEVNAALFLAQLDDDKKQAEEELAMWGITKVYMYEDESKVLSIHNFFDRLPVPKKKGKSLGLNYIFDLNTPERMKMFEQE